MSISSEITRLQTAKANIKTSIENKGVTVPSATKLDGYPTLIDSIPSGGSAVIEPLSVTSNGTYTAPTGVDGYSPVSVNVSGGGGGGVSPKQINFYDYDGTCLHSFTASEWANETALPSNPSHTGLTAQGWNWTKAQIDAQLVSTPEQDINVGQMYITDDGKTRLYVHFDKHTRHPYLGIGVNGTVEVDWGDGSATSTITGSSLTSATHVDHNYASAGDYVITLTVSSGSFVFLGDNWMSYTLMKSPSATANDNMVYEFCLKKVEIGANAGIYNYAFYYCSLLMSITIPNSVMSIGTYAFEYCRSLKSITIPDGVTNISDYMLRYCLSLMQIAIPDGVTNIRSNAFNGCNSLESITIPDSVTSIGASAFLSCYKIASITMPDSIRSIEKSTFSTCCSLKTIEIPSNITDIGTSAFSNCYSMMEYHFKPTTPPTLANANAFNNIVTDCIIYVPAESLNAYKTATNWRTYASRMQGE